MGLNELKIATKLWAFIVLVIAGICAVAIVGLLRSANILAEGREKQSQMEELVQVSTEWNGLTMTNAARNQAIMLAEGTAVNDSFKEPINATSAQISELQKKIEAMPLTDADKVQMKKIGDLRKSVIELRTKARDAKAAGNPDEALQIMNGQYLPAMAAYIGAQKEMVELQKKQLNEAKEVTERRRGANSVGIMVGLAVIVSAIFAGTAWLVRSIREPLAQANDLAARIAQGDLSSVISTKRADEFGALLVSLRAMNESLAGMVSQVRQSTDSIAIASSEIATGNNDLAQRTEQTSSNLQATASSMDGLTITVQQSADNARQASALAASASSVAQRGGDVVTQVISTMQEIDASSKKIADIISVIDGIAFQTNILALNAAVEAARAGEQGRGFAVVAAEVRSLAQRSSGAAREIKALIDDSVARVQTGSQLVHQAGATMSEIVESINHVTDIMRGIAAASAEQMSGIGRVNRDIDGMNTATQQNAAMVEQAAADAKSLQDQAGHLERVVSTFKLKGVAHAAAPNLQLPYDNGR